MLADTLPISVAHCVSISEAVRRRYGQAFRGYDDDPIVRVGQFVDRAQETREISEDSIGKRMELFLANIFFILRFGCLFAGWEDGVPRQ